MELQAKDVRDVEILEEGMKFKNFTIVELDHVDDGDTRSKIYKQFYKVRCDCGKEYVRKRHSILYNHKASCPFCKLEYPKTLKVGDPFGKLIILGVDESSKLSKDGKDALITEWKYLCHCECGNVTSVSRQKLVSGNTQSCGCLKSESMSATFSKENNYKDLGNGITKVEISNRPGEYFMIETEDWVDLKEHTWRLMNSGYVCTNKKGSKDMTLLHRELLGLNMGDELVGDHKTGNKLDYTRKNLRVCTQGDNVRNKIGNKNSSSPFSGINKRSENNKWSVCVEVEGSILYLGCYFTVEEALQVRFEAELEHYGEFSPILCRGIYKEYNLAVPEKYHYLL